MIKYTTKGILNYLKDCPHEISDEVSFADEGADWLEEHMDELFAYDEENPPKIIFPDEESKQRFITLMKEMNEKDAKH